MTLIALNVANIISYDWSRYDKVSGCPLIAVRYTVKWNKNNTYTIIFGANQAKEYAFFKENCGGFNILYESPKALNINHPGENRNILIIFEVQERFFV